MASNYSVLTHEQLKAQLDDTQASLAAALARIEGMRIKEKQLVAELSALRKQVHGQNAGSSPAAEGKGPRSYPVQSGSNDPSRNGSSAALANLGSAEPSSSRSPASTWEGDAKKYVSNCDGEHPVCIVNGSKKTPVNLILTKDTVEFVEVKARITQADFVGISTMKSTLMPSTDAASAAEATGQAAVKAKAKPSFLASCFSAATPPKASSRDGDDSPAFTDPCKALDPFARGNQAGASTSGGSTGVWQILWGRDGAPQRMAFEAITAVRQSLHKHTERWLGVDVADGEGGDAAYEDDGTDEAALVPPRNMVVGDLTMNLLGEPSTILSDEHIRALASVVPPLERMRDWTLTYSTAKHGISLATLYRKSSVAAAAGPTLIVVKDFGGYVFGAYTCEAWRVAPRFYGSGETFVFQLEPFRVIYPWRAMSKAKNDFFMYGTPECLAVGGLGHFAIWLDSELLQGSSGTCGTFGSPCLAHKEEFKIQTVEVWHACS